MINTVVENEIKIYKQFILEAYDDRSKLEGKDYYEAVFKTLDLLNKGKIRVAIQKEVGLWEVNIWIKKAILLYFSLTQNKNIKAGELMFYDRIPLRTDFELMGVRAVPGAICRYASFVEKGAILMPSFVNIGAYVASGTMVDTWATVGSCAQVGKNVHLSGGVGLGGVLEPPQSLPVVIEDNAFLGSRCIIVEGVLVGEGAVLGSNVTITASTPIIDVSQNEEIIYKGKVPARSVVIPGTRVKKFPAGDYNIPAALIIGKRKESTDKKTSLEQALRDFEISV